MTYDLAWLVKNYADFFSDFGIEQPVLLAHYDEWKLQSNDRSVTGYLWYLFHVLLGETQKQMTNRVDYHRNLHDIYVKMLEFRVGVEKQNGNKIVQAIIKNRILQWQLEMAAPFRLQAISLDCCAFCESINGKDFSPEEVLENPHFASDQCSKEGACSCGYSSITQKAV